MKLNIVAWLEQYIQLIRELFGDRIYFAGLQGSYGRGEETKDSDIDVVLILDDVTVQDLKAYDRALSILPERELVCGFISGKRELENWEKSDLFQFCYDTTPVIGSLDELAATIDTEDVRRAIRIGACNLYHMCGHNMLHEKDAGILVSLYKSAVFVCQAVHYGRTGEYVGKKKELLPNLPAQERPLLETSIRLKEQGVDAVSDFDLLSGQLFEWAKQLIRTYKA